MQADQFGRDKRTGEKHVHSQDALPSRRVFPECHASACISPALLSLVEILHYILPADYQADYKAKLHWFLRKPIKRLR